ncbi:MAG: HEPN domain-containing protein [bacterium]|nr:HEPN domain-containing protein [bacterium]
MPNSNIKAHEEWIKKVADDELNAQSILTHRDGAPSGVCFLSQQIAEKYLKALLVFHQKPFLKVHDLLELETRLLEIEPDVKTLHQELVSLNRYYIETRYPGDYPDFSWQDADEAFKAASDIANFVKQRIHS